MHKPPSQNVPGMTDTLEFVKNLWGGMGVPGVSALNTPGLGAPSLSTDDLDKRITDLKTVETWLNLNLTMLRTTIQALEVQRGTLVALKSMSDSMAQAMGQKGDQTASLPPFAAFFNAIGTQQAGTQPAAPPPPSAQPGSDGAAADPAMPAAVAWWNVLQDQFSKAVASTMPVDGGSPDKPVTDKTASDKGAASRTPGDKGPADTAPTAVPDPAQRATGGGDTGGTPGTSSQKPPRTKSDKA
ncbi:PhaM family polyhydroxyalkanoate granule multifunctional regulatory protein [Massilia sp. CMS3.1]|uniref:PhaM family polyhydroxyalkanoate granule multifunctional regulatory protein n=1 Tax=Massilia sp. CMS3.1 TaxID=3373083 RepID=UPI003EE460A2